jgi:hypothetical protein
MYKKTHEKEMVAYSRAAVCFLCKSTHKRNAILLAMQPTGYEGGLARPPRPEMVMNLLCCIVQKVQSSVYTVVTQPQLLHV